jgi:AraC-like DNA-binding protein
MAGCTQTINAGDFLYCAPKTHHSYWADAKNPWTIYWMHVSGPRLRLYENELKLLPGHWVLQAGVRADLIGLFQTLLQRYVPHPKDLDCLAVQAIAQSILANALALPAAGSDISRQRLVVQRAVTCMTEKVAHPLALDELACGFGMSAEHFCRMFRKVTGQPPMRFFNRLRIQRACAMLASGAAVQEAADQLGFSDPYYFSRLFKRTIGVSPLAYKHSTANGLSRFGQSCASGGTQPGPRG